MGDLDERLARIGAIVVEDRVLRRVIKRHREGLGLAQRRQAALPVARGIERRTEGELEIKGKGAVSVFGLRQFNS